MCFGQPVEPPTQKAARFVLILKIINVIQILIVILNFIFQKFVAEGLFGLFAIFLIFKGWRQLSYQSLLAVNFVSIYFAISFLAYLMTPVQQGIPIQKMDSRFKYLFAVSCISCAYYTFLAAFVFYPYRQFKSIQFSTDPTFNQFINYQNQQNQQNQQPIATGDPYNLDYGKDIEQPTKQKQQQTFEVFKGKGVRIG